METPLKKKNCVPIKYINDQEDSDIIDFENTTANDLQLQETNPKESVIQYIRQNKAVDSSTIDLCRKCISSIPKELRQISTIEYLYLEGNDLSFLPEDFFKVFLQLKWLDLRNNKLCHFPTMCLGEHACLRNILLGNNMLKCLPLELGLIKTLHGLNVANNPLEFPPEDIVSLGVRGIQHFLKKSFYAKFSNDCTTVNNAEEAVDCDFDDSGNHSSSSDDWNTTASMMDLTRPNNNHMASFDATDSYSGTVDNSSHTYMATHFFKDHHRQNVLRGMKTFNNNVKYGQSDAVTSYSLCPNSKQGSGSVVSWKVNCYPEPPCKKLIASRMAERQVLAKLKGLNDTTNAILQKEKNMAVLRDWRSDAKRRQATQRGVMLTRGMKEYPDIAGMAPFGIDKSYMRILTNDEHVMAQKREEETKKVLSPASVALLQEEKSIVIGKLEARIKEHTAHMMERRKKPRGTPQQEMEAACRELDVVKKLQKELMSRYQELKTLATGHPFKGRRPPSHNVF